MEDPRQPFSARRTLALILVPMLGTVVCLRLYLHLVHVRHVYPGGYLVHHLFIGVLIEIPAAFLLAFGSRYRALTRIAVGIGSGLILDEVVYLVATNATDADYVSHLSLAGSGVLLGLATILLFALYLAHRDEG